MQPISGLISGAAQPPAAITGVKEPPKVRQPEDVAQSRLLKPAVDKYIPGEKQEPTGRYWPGKDEDGKPKIYFDDPEQAEDIPDQSKDAEEAKSCTVNTDKVDREIEKLKKQKQELEQQISRETDETKVKDLKAKLAQVERELRQKDNDTYRRQHSTFSGSFAG